MTLTLRKNQVHYTGVMHAVMSLQFTQVHNFHAKAGRETGKRIFYGWFLLCNNNMATNLQSFTLNNCRRRFAARRHRAGNAARH